MTDLLLKHFDLALEASDGIGKLRTLILNLGIKGQLVTQNQKDQPSKDLLQEIKVIKTRLIKLKKLKIGQLTSDSKFLDQIKIPNTWEWAKGEDIFFITKLAGFEYSKYVKLTETGEIPVIRAQNVKPGKLDLRNLMYIDSKTSYLLNRCAITKKSLLVTFIGAGIGDVALFDLNERWHLAPNVAKMETFEGCDDKINLKFINYYLFSNAGRNEIFKHLKSTAQPSISMGTIRDIDYPIPPISEQNRIVEKINQLMDLCDKLEAEKKERDKKRVTVHTAAVNKLLSAKDKPEFIISWNFITRNFNELYSVPQNVEELKKAILQLAMMGKLVPQDPNDQPAHQLLKDIDYHKKILFKNKKEKSQKILAENRPEEFPYALPQNWQWTNLGNIAISITDGVHYAPTYLSKGIPCISAKDVYNDKINLINCNYVSTEEYNSQKDKFALFKNSLLVTKSGSIGRTAIYDGSFPLYLVESIGVINLFDGLIDPKYIKYLLNRIFTSITYKGDYVRGLAVKHLTLTLLASIIIPLPPYSEQKRIVAKIDQLMKLCDYLELQFKNSSKKQSEMLNAVLAHI